ncbi:hypothetical protein GPJ56_000401 [Histomonas meleagridis]|uniref:uncharacterized protein n=1 Tax=Histomonas meleagridis TaxID=135588 RepID=UPI00355A3778|nr:hypothetical protein GPJ56_000401 [Histomonas meleagridis]KAH0796559.1 hypothetical protein GO595_010452 [Histomonas meleagridis]
MFSGESKAYTCSVYIENYMKEIETFLQGKYTSFRYEPLGRRFIGKAEIGDGKHALEDLVGLQPMLNIIKTFGMPAAIQIDCILMSHIVNRLMVILNSFEKAKTILSELEFKFYNEGTIQCDKTTFDQIREASESLLVMGLLVEVRKILSDALEIAYTDAFPGFYDSFISAFQRMFKKCGEDDFTFIEAVEPSLSNYFLEKRVKTVLKNVVNPIPFSFYLGMLLANDKWDDLRFEPEDDLFTHNLQLIPGAVEMIYELAPILFTKTDTNAIDDAIKFFFTIASGVATEKRKINQKLYDSFVIFIDHFPALTNLFHYGIIEHAFPYSTTRACYVDIAT